MNFLLKLYTSIVSELICYYRGHRWKYKGTHLMYCNIYKCKVCKSLKDVPVVKDYRRIVKG